MIKGVGVGCLECYSTLLTLFQKLASSSNFIKINSNILKAARDFLLPHFWNTHSRTWKGVLKFSEFQMVSVVTEPIA